MLGGWGRKGRAGYGRCRESPNPDRQALPRVCFDVRTGRERADLSGTRRRNVYGRMHGPDRRRIYDRRDCEGPGNGSSSQ